MNVGIIKSNTVINAIVCETIDIAKQFLKDGAFDDADSVIELPGGYWIGDTYKNKKWTKAPEPEMPEMLETMEQTMSHEELVDIVMALVENSGDAKIMQRVGIESATIKAEVNA